jgi:hypothetical protein
VSERPAVRRGAGFFDSTLCSEGSESVLDARLRLVEEDREVGDTEGAVALPKAVEDQLVEFFVGHGDRTVVGA